MWKTYKSLRLRVNLAGTGVSSKDRLRLWALISEMCASPGPGLVLDLSLRAHSTTTRKKKSQI